MRALNPLSLNWNKSYIFRPRCKLPSFDLRGNSRSLELPNIFFDNFSTGKYSEEHFGPNLHQTPRNKLLPSEGENNEAEISYGPCRAERTFASFDYLSFGREKCEKNPMKLRINYPNILRGCPNAEKKMGVTENVSSKLTLLPVDICSLKNKKTATTQGQQ